MAITFTLQPDTDQSRIVVTVAGVTNTQARVVRVSSGGVASTIRGGDPATFVGGAGVFLDFEAPLDTPLTYQIRNIANDGVQGSSGTVVLPSEGLVWLKHPGTPTLNMTLRVEDFPSEENDIPQAIFKPIGRKFPVAVSSRRFAETGTLTAITSTLGERDAIKAILDSGSTLLLQAPAGWGVGSNYVAVGVVTADRLIPYGPDPQRRWTLPLTYVDSPVGMASAGVGNSCADVIATYATCADVLDAKATCAALITRVAADV